MIKKSLLAISIASVLSAQSTMCYKENHLSPSTIETISLDGGECNGSKSVQSMKADGWKVSNINMNPGTSGMNYMYVFSQGDTTLRGTMQSISREDIKKEMRVIAKEEQVALEKARIQKDAQNGERIYKSVCAKCHGSNGEIEAYNKSAKLTSMSEKEIIRAIADYTLDDKDNGLKMIMKPYADALQEDEVKQVAAYIQTLKK